MSHVKTNQPSAESLHLVAEAYRMALEAQVQKAKQAEEMVAELMLEKISEADFVNRIIVKINEHIDAIGLHKAQQYEGIIQTTLLALAALQKTSPSPDLVEIIKALTLSIECSK